MSLKIPEAIRDTLAKEFRVAATKMAEESDVRSKLYFLSAMFGACSRAFNQVWIDDLALLHMVLRNANSEVNNRLIAMAANAEHPIKIAPEVFSILTEAAGQLADMFQAEEIDTTDLYRVLVRIAEAAYSTTGNGYYLYLKGTLKI